MPRPVKVKQDDLNSKPGILFIFSSVKSKFAALKTVVSFLV